MNYLIEKMLGNASGYRLEIIIGIIICFLIILAIIILTIIKKLKDK